MHLSEEYKQQLQKLHQDDETWGTSGKPWAYQIIKLARKHECNSILDYGCGKGLLGAQIVLNAPNNITVHDYDPGVPRFSKTPEPADMVVSTDVFEHIEPMYLNNVLDHISQLVKKVGFFVIATHPARHHLPDGRNAHLIVEGADFWIPKIEARFKDVSYTVKSPSNELVVTAIK